MLIQRKTLNNNSINNPACEYLHDQIRRRVNSLKEPKYNENIHTELCAPQVQLGVASEKL